MAFIRILTVSTGAMVLAIGGLAMAGSAEASNCLNIGNGNLCNQYDPQGYNVSYTRNGGSGAPLLDFNLVCATHTFGDLGPFTAPNPSTHSYVFKVGAQGSCFVRLFDKTNGGYFNGPSATHN